MKNALFNKLLSTPLKDCDKPIKKLRIGPLAGDYDHFIRDYTKIKSELTGECVDTYSAGRVHGNSIYDGLVRFVYTNNCKAMLDLGCGDGELLLTLKTNKPDIEPYGVTIHIGEVEKARKRGLNNVLPLDMREVGMYFDEDFFDLIIAHCSLQYIEEDERIQVAKDAYKLLRRGGFLVVVDYQGESCSKLPQWANYEPYCRQYEMESIPAMGDVVVLKKP